VRRERPMTIATKDNKKAKPLILLGLMISSRTTIKNNTLFDVLFSFFSSLYAETNKYKEDTRRINKRTAPTNTIEEHCSNSNE
jgi:hypothetical protein